MSNSTGEKQFDATSSRIAKAKREGNVARSQEFAGNCAFAAGALAAFAVVPLIGEFASIAISKAMREVQVLPLLGIVICSLVPIAASALAGTAGSIVQNGGVQFVPISLKLDRLQPLQGLKRLLSRETILHAVRAAVAFSIATAAIVGALRDLFATVSSQNRPQHVAAVAWAGAQHVILAAAAVGAIFAVAEYAVARRGWLQKLKMSFEELKRDRKEHEGDPLARSRRKTLHRSLVRGSIAKVKDASFVVVNPTHVAVALQYRPPEVPVPAVLVRAVDEAALRVREVAAEWNIPIVEHVVLARALLRDSVEGAAIPHEHYVAVAEIVAALIRSGAFE